MNSPKKGKTTHSNSFKNTIIFTKMHRQPTIAKVMTGTLDTLTIIIPIICSGALFVGFGMYLYLAAASRDLLYGSMALFLLCAFLFVGAEAQLIVIGTLQKNWSAGIQVHRMEQIFALFFLPALPFFLRYIIGLRGAFTTVNRILIMTGAAVAIAFTAAAFIKPDLFVSITEHDKDWLTIPGDYGRGQEGILYTVRDLLLGLYILYSVAVIITDMVKNRSLHVLLTIFIGLLIAVFFAADDIIYVYTEKHIDPFGHRSFSRFSVGITVFALFSMASVFRKFIMQRQEIEEAYEISTWSRQELEKTNVSLSRFVPDQFLKFLDRENILNVRVGDHVEREMTVLFCDINDFTALSEKLTPAENFGFINSYLREMVPIIRHHNGFVDKFVGDEIMALFPGSCDDALQAAVEMHRQLYRYNEGRARAGYTPIGFGIGIHTDEMMLGTIGDDQRMDSTVISDGVNLASRIESLTKQMGLVIAVSEASFLKLKLPGDFQFRFIGKLPVKGKSEPVSVLEVLDGFPAEMKEKKISSQADFETGISHFYTREFTQARENFRQVLKILPDDKAALHYLSKITS